MKRPLSRLERAVSHFGMNLMVAFKTCKDLDENMVKKALILAAQKYPYLRTRLVKGDVDDRDILYFVEETNLNQLFARFRVEWFELATDDEFEDWPRRFHFFSSINYDTSAFIFHAQMYWLRPNKYQLYFAANHAGLFRISTAADIGWILSLRSKRL